MNRRFSFQAKPHKRLLLFLSVCCFSGFLVSTGCRNAKAPANFILITLDTQRADFISAYNPGNAQTPHIDSLARKGILFENAFSLIPITLPAHAAIFYSEPPWVVKNYNNGQEIRKKRARPSFVNLFKKKGLATAAFISLGVLRAEFGLNEGFDRYEDAFPENRWYLTAEEVNAKVLPWLEEQKDRRFFLWVHYSDPHDPYAPPTTPNDLKLYLNDEFIGEACLSKYTRNAFRLNLRPGINLIRLDVENEVVPDPDQFKARLDRIEVLSLPDQTEMRADLVRGWFIRREDNVFFFKNQSYIEVHNDGPTREALFVFRGKLLFPVSAIRDNYRKEVEYMDEEIGKLWAKLEELKLADRTAVLLIGDHGEGLGEFANDFGDPHIGHIHYLYNVYLKVPFIIYNPSSSTKGLRRAQFVSLLDVAPTVSGIMKMESLPQFQGRNLLNLRENEPASIYQETHRPESVRDRFGLIRFPWHMIFTPEDKINELYDLRSDPEEKRNFYGTPEADRQTAVMKKDLEAFAREALKNKEVIKINKKAEEMLRSLGYLNK